MERVGVNWLKHAKKHRYGPLINHKLTELIISCVYDNIPETWIQTSKRVDRNLFFFSLSVWDLITERPIGCKEWPSQPHRAALPLVSSVDWRVEVQGNNTATGSEAGWSTYRSNKALLPNLRAQRHREVLFTLYSRFSVEFGSVESSCVAIDWFCVVQLITLQSYLLY